MMSRRFKRIPRRGRFPVDRNITVRSNSGSNSGDVKSPPAGSSVATTAVSPEEPFHTTLRPSHSHGVSHIQPMTRNISTRTQSEKIQNQPSLSRLRDDNRSAPDPPMVDWYAELLIEYTQHLQLNSAIFDSEQIEPMQLAITVLDLKVKELTGIGSQNGGHLRRGDVNIGAMLLQHAQALVDQRKQIDRQRDEELRQSKQSQRQTLLSAKVHRKHTSTKRSSLDRSASDTSNSSGVTPAAVVGAGGNRDGNGGGGGGGDEGSILSTTVSAGTSAGRSSSSSSSIGYNTSTRTVSKNERMKKLYARKRKKRGQKRFRNTPQVGVRSTHMEQQQKKEKMGDQTSKGSTRDGVMNSSKRTKMTRPKQQQQQQQQQEAAVHISAASSASTASTASAKLLGSIRNSSRKRHRSKSPENIISEDGRSEIFRQKPDCIGYVNGLTLEQWQAIYKELWIPQVRSRVSSSSSSSSRQRFNAHNSVEPSLSHISCSKQCSMIPYDEHTFVCRSSRNVHRCGVEWCSSKNSQSTLTVVCSLTRRCLTQFQQSTFNNGGYTVPNIYRDTTQTGFVNTAAEAHAYMFNLERHPQFDTEQTLLLKRIWVNGLGFDADEDLKRGNSFETNAESATKTDVSVRGPMKQFELLVALLWAIKHKYLNSSLPRCKEEEFRSHVAMVLRKASSPWMIRLPSIQEASVYPFKASANRSVDVQTYTLPTFAYVTDQLHARQDQLGVKLHEICQLEATKRITDAENAVIKSIHAFQNAQLEPFEVKMWKRFIECVQTSVDS